jgi:hypothetical protein
MADFNIRSESIDVEQIMRQIRSRIQEKRGVDYTEEQVRELASVRLEKFLDPKNLRSDLIEQFRRSRQFPPGELGPIQPPYEFSDQTLFTSHRGLLRLIRRLLNPVLKLFFNPNTLNQVLYAQAQFNSDMLQRDRDWQTLYYEVLHNLVLETTRSGIELRNMKMRLEALSSRLEFSERRVRALEGVVQYRPEIVRTRDRDRERQRERPASQWTGESQADASPTPTPSAEGIPTSADQAASSVSVDPSSRRRRRRRRGRRGSGLAPVGPAGSESSAPIEERSADVGVSDVEGVGGDEVFDDGDEVEALTEASQPSATPDEGDADRPDPLTPNDPDRQ